MACQRQGLQFNMIGRGIKMKMKHAFGPIILACVLFHYHTHSIEKFSITD